MALDPELTASTLQGGGIALVGVTMVDEVEQVRPPLNDTLEKILAASHPGLALRRAESVQETLGLPLTRAILFRYQQQGAVDGPSLADLAARLAATSRYALFARVEKSTVHPPGRPREAEVRYGTLESSWSARRDARVRFTLYDLRRRAIVLEATYASSSDNAIPDSLAYRPTRPRVIGPGEEGAVMPDFAPETPSVADAIVEACRAFAVDLPQ